MKYSVLIIFLLFSLSALADLEHKAGMGTLPQKQKLSEAHACFDEIDHIGCGHPRDDQEFFIGCLDENKDELTPSCRIFFQKLYGKKKQT